MNLNSVLLSSKSNLGYCGILFAEAIAVSLEYYNQLFQERMNYDQIELTSQFVKIT